MAETKYINKVVYGGRTLVDLTGDTATADKVLKDLTFMIRQVLLSQVHVHLMWIQAMQL